VSDLARQQAERLLAALARAAQLYPEDVAATLPEGIDTGQVAPAPAPQRVQPGDGNTGGRR
jgi:hypothetical protein